MTIIAKPAGRGRWNSITMTVTGSRAAPFTVEVGDRFDLGGITWRVVAVLPEHLEWQTARYETWEPLGGEGRA